MASITLGDVTTRIQNLLGTDAQLSAAEIQSIAISRYELLHDARPWSKRLKDFTVAIVAVTSSHTDPADTNVQATFNGSTVTANSAIFTASQNGYQMRIGQEVQFYMVSFNSTTSLTLQDGTGIDAVWPHATSSSLSWTLFKSFYSLPTDCDFVLSVGANYQLEELDGGRDRLDLLDPNRLSTSDAPRYWLMRGVDTNSVRQIEFWPVPVSARILRGQYAQEAAQVVTASVLNIHPAVLTWAVAADCYNMLAAKTADQAYLNLALFYEKKATEALNDILPYEVSKTSPPRSISRQRHTPGRGTDFATNHDIDALDNW